MTIKQSVSNVKYCISESESPRKSGKIVTMISQSVSSRCNQLIIIGKYRNFHAIHGYNMTGEPLMKIHTFPMASLVKKKLE